MTSHLEKIEKHTQQYIHTYIHSFPKNPFVICHLLLITYNASLYPIIFCVAHLLPSKGMYSMNRTSTAQSLVS